MFEITLLENRSRKEMIQAFCVLLNLYPLAIVHPPIIICPRSATHPTPRGATADHPGHASSNHALHDCLRRTLKIKLCCSNVITPGEGRAPGRALSGGARSKIQRERGKRWGGGGSTRCPRAQIYQVHNISRSLQADDAAPTPANGL